MVPLWLVADRVDSFLGQKNIASHIISTHCAFHYDNQVIKWFNPALEFQNSIDSAFNLIFELSGQGVGGRGSSSEVISKLSW